MPYVSGVMAVLWSLAVVGYVLLTSRSFVPSDRRVGIHVALLAAAVTYVLQYIMEVLFWYQAARGASQSRSLLYTMVGIWDGLGFALIILAVALAVRY